MHTNGTQKSEPFAKLGEIAHAPLPGKRPRSWSTALEICRKAKGWTQKQLLAEALPTENVGLADVKRWELERAYPTLNQCQKLRAALPALAAYDDLLRLELRADPRAKKAPLPPQKPEGWPGPAVKTFAEAMAWARVRHGMSERDVCNLLGVSTLKNWIGGAPMIRGTFERLCEILPELRFGPQPRFSARVTNQPMTKAFLAAEETRREIVRAQLIVEPEAAPPPRTKAPAAPDAAAHNMAGANYGVLVAAKMSLEAEKGQIEKRHMAELLAIEEKIERATAAIADAQTQMETAVRTMHGGA